MYFTRVNYAIFICFLLQFIVVRSQLVSKIAHRLFGSPVKDLCSLGSAELMRRNGYLVEEHSIVTDDGYILTAFRCNSKKPFYGPKKPLILQHGIISSSDDFCINIPSQAPAYVFADAGYDVWLPNLRGNTYSKKHTNMTIQNPKFWDFSFTDIAYHDYPAIIDYVLQQTGFSKVCYVAHSQGTTSLMILLSEKPEYNQKVAAASLLAPVAYLGNSGRLLQVLGTVAPILSAIKNFGYFERLPIMSNLYGEACSLDMMHICSSIIDTMCGASSGQRNETMMPAFMCHLPSGASVKQVMHFAQEVKHGFFGPYKTGWRVPKNFNLPRITTPMTLHFSPTDTFTNPKDMKRLISELNSVVYVQEVNEKNFGHMDFLWGIKAAENIYSKVLRFLQMYG